MQALIQIILFAETQILHTNRAIKVINVKQ